MSDRLDELTPRERETFELLRLGLTNDEITQRLDITLDGAKYHVSQILSKLGVSSREDAATFVVPPVRNRSWQAWPLALRIAVLVLSGALIAGIGLLGFGVLRTDRSDDADGATGTAPLISLARTSDDPLAVAAYHNTSKHSLIGDHWHATYAIFVGNFRLPNAPTWESGIHTHGDGIIHIHPFQSFEEGRGAALYRWFEYGGGLLTEVKLRVPGQSGTYLKGNSVPSDGRPGEIYVILGGSCDTPDLSGQWIRVPPDYRPQDGDCIRIMFEPEGLMREHIKNPPSVPESSNPPICTPNPTDSEQSTVCSDVAAR